MSSAVGGLDSSAAIESAILFLWQLAILLLLSLLLLTLLLGLHLLLAHLHLPLGHLGPLTSKSKNLTALELFWVCVRDTLSFGLSVELDVELVKGIMDTEYGQRT